MMADKYGRKWLLVVNVIQMQLRSCWIYLIRKLRPQNLKLACIELRCLSEDYENHKAHTILISEVRVLEVVSTNELQRLSIIT